MSELRAETSKASVFASVFLSLLLSDFWNPEGILIWEHLLYHSANAILVFQQ